MQRRLNGATDVKFPFSHKIGGVRFFGRSKMPDKHLHAVSAYSRAPAFPNLMPRNAKQPGFISGVRSTLILYVVGSCHVAQIAKRIIGGVAVNMVYIVCRGGASNIQPRQPIGAISCFAQPNSQIPVRAPKARSGANFDPTIRFHAPGKNASLWVVVKYFSDLLGSYTSHAGSVLMHMRPAYYESLG